MLENLLTPKEVSVKLRISVPTITRCVQRGAPVHRWGSTGRRYRIDISEFVRWMEAQGTVEQPKAAATCTMEELARRRRAALQAL